MKLHQKIVIKNCSIFCRKLKRRVTAFFRSKLKVCTIMRSLNATFILTWLMKINRFKDLDHFYVGYSSLSYNLSGLINFMMDVANQHNNGFRNSDHNPNLTTCFSRRMKNFESPWLPQILRFQISFSFFISLIQYIFQNKFSFSYVLDRFYETTYPDSFAIRRFPSHLPNRGLSLPIDISLYDFLTLRIKKNATFPGNNRKYSDNPWTFRAKKAFGWFH